MLFNSLEFLLAFLPATVLVYWLLQRLDRGRMAVAWLTVMSLVFYGWWNPAYLWLLAGSISANYGLSLSIDRAAAKRSLTVFGVALNLALIGYFKYANFFLDSLDLALGTDWQIPAIVLPLAISFFTFQQIAYLVDVFRGEAPTYRPLDYVLFVTFFPQLIAGPIVHHQEVIPQFDRSRSTAIADTTTPSEPETKAALSPPPYPISLGLTIFTIGLAKKIWIADPLATIATPLFERASDGEMLTTIEAWTAALFYTFQLYFDFSGYSDMAIGAARLFGIILPFNFDSPYKALNISDFWRRWHVTLSNFLRDYLYIPLGGSRSGDPLLNVGITMLLGGLWHGAGWTFVIWGGLHGLYLGLHRMWRRLWQGREGLEDSIAERLSRACGWLLTFFAVMLSWVIFRADRLETAGSVLRSALLWTTTPLGELDMWHGTIAIGLLVFVTIAPNTLEIAYRYGPALHLRDRHRDAVPAWLSWRPYPWLGAVLGAAIFLALQTLLLAPESEFLYFQF